MPEANDDTNDWNAKLQELKDAKERFEKRISDALALEQASLNPTDPKSDDQTK